MSKNDLDTKKVGDIEGTFYIPDYQRGYRWGKEEVTLLLRDLQSNGSQPYCLQPIVVKKNGTKYELIDGQQRLTTIYLIYKYLAKKLTNNLYEPRFNLEYQTREKSAEFLDNIDMSRKDENIDFYHIANAYQYIADFFELRDGQRRNPRPSELTTIDINFTNFITVIWYEVDSEENGVELFERLNIGKIPLTCSELVKALFLKESAAEQLKKRVEEISLQWDLMEQTLGEESFWAFLTNAKSSDYATRIDLVLDLIAQKPIGCREKYHTFFYFDNLIESKQKEVGPDALTQIWDNIFHTFQTLREWYLNHNFYHKIGYLISSGTLTVADIYDIWRGKSTDGSTSGNDSTATTSPLNKDDFERRLDEKIAESIAVTSVEELKSLSYSNAKDNKLIHNILLLFNVETERLMDEGKRRFPFDKHKEADWSLEHIHAQHSEGLATNRIILEWLVAHRRALKTFEASVERDLLDDFDRLIEEIKVGLTSGQEPRNVRKRFADIQSRTVRIFTESNENPSEEYRDALANLALIDCGKNAALSNYVFDAKRDIIIEYDKEGRYIPVCTKMTFFKYYSSGDTSLHFWGQKDRECYIDAIARIVSPYFKKETTSMQTIKF